MVYMNGYLIQQKLYKVGEFGFGRPIVAIKSGHKYLHENDQKFNNFDRNFKVILFHLDLAVDEVARNRNFSHTLNEYDFAETYILDFPAFVHLVQNHAKIKIAHSNLKNLIIVNPIDGDAGIIKKLTGKEYVNITSEKFRLNSTDLKRFQNALSNAHLIHCEKVDIISIQDKHTALKLASQMKNSKLHLAKDAGEIFDLIQMIIKNESRPN